MAWIREGIGDGDERAEGMANEYRPRDAELEERLVQELRLAERREAAPDAIAVSRPIERGYAVMPRGFGEHPGKLEVFDHAAQAVQQHDRWAVPRLEIMQVANEPAARGVLVPRAPCLRMDEEPRARRCQRETRGAVQTGRS
jgi:hypothetical protein